MCAGLERIVHTVWNADNSVMTRVGIVGGIQTGRRIMLRGEGIWISRATIVGNLATGRRISPRDKTRRETGKTPGAARMGTRNPKDNHGWWGFDLRRVEYRRCLYSNEPRGLLFCNDSMCSGKECIWRSNGGFRGGYKLSEVCWAWQKELRSTEWWWRTYVGVLQDFWMFRLEVDGTRGFCV